MEEKLESLKTQLALILLTHRELAERINEMHKFIQELEDNSITHGLRVATCSQPMLELKYYLKCIQEELDKATINLDKPTGG